MVHWMWLKYFNKRVPMIVTFERCGCSLACLLRWSSACPYARHRLHRVWQRPQPSMFACHEFKVRGKLMSVVSCWVSYLAAHLKDDVESLLQDNEEVEEEWHFWDEYVLSTYSLLGEVLEERAGDADDFQGDGGNAGAVSISDSDWIMSARGHAFQWRTRCNANG